VIANLKPYPRDKESSQAWLGAVPEHWSVVPHRALFAEVKDRNHPNEVMLSVTITRGIVRQRALLDGSSKKDSSNQDKSSYKLVQPRDIAYNKMRAWQGAIGASHLQGIISPAYVVMRLRNDNALPEYFHHLFRSPQFAKEAERWSYGITSDMWSLRPEHFKMIYSPLPPPAEQAAIARFLDWANGRLERTIQAKRKVIALLNEQKQAIIHRAVTRGLDPAVPLKPSGIPWLSDIPQHWEARKIRAVATRVTKGTTPTTIGRQFVDSGIRFVKVESISADRSILESNCAFIDDATDKLLSRSRLRAHDVVISIAGAIGRAAIIAPSLLPANTNQAVAIISPRAHLCLPEWLTYVLASPMCLRAMTDASVQSAQPNLSLASLGRTAIPLPPVHEQESILRCLSGDTASVTDATSRLEREITLLREYRTRLVADVVTGKLDVRDVAARLPDEAPLDTIDDGTDLTVDTDVTDEEFEE
jgi:type I restriction enzyme S subunit